MSVDLPEFDVLVKMAQDDPEKLEQLRQDACEQLIQSAPEEYQRRLRGLQFKIDMERRKAKTPMAACIKISEMMHDSFEKLRDSLNEAQAVKAPTLKSVFEGGKTSVSKKQTTTAESDDKTVVQFPALT